MSLLALASKDLNAFVIVGLAYFLCFLLVVMSVTDRSGFLEVQMGILASLVIALASGPLVGPRYPARRGRLRHAKVTKLTWT